MGKTLRSLYQCSHAKVKIDDIYCAKGHKIGLRHGNLIITKLVRGEPLEITACQDCPDYDEMGGPIPKEERGWMNVAGG